MKRFDKAFHNIDFEMLKKLSIAIGATALFSIPAITLLFKRSLIAVLYTAVISVIFLLLTFLLFLFKPEMIYIPLILVTIQLYISYYLYNLSKDGLLK